MYNDRFDEPNVRKCLSCGEMSVDRWHCDCPDCGKKYHHECEHCGEDMSEQ